MTKLVYFHHKDCSVCHDVAPLVEGIAIKCNVEYVDAETREGLMRAYDMGVKRVPTIIVLGEDACQLPERFEAEGIRKMAECLKISSVRAG